MEKSKHCNLNKIFLHVKTGQQKSQMQQKVARLKISFSVSEPKQSALPGHTCFDTKQFFKPGNDIQDVLQSMAVISWETNRSVHNRCEDSSCWLFFWWHPHWLLVGMGVLRRAYGVHARMPREPHTPKGLQGFYWHLYKRPTFFFNTGFNLTKHRPIWLNG